MPGAGAPAASCAASNSRRAMGVQHRLNGDAPPNISVQRHQRGGEASVPHIRTSCPGSRNRHRHRHPLLREGPASSTGWKSTRKAAQQAPPSQLRGLGLTADPPRSDRAAAPESRYLRSKGDTGSSGAKALPADIAPHADAPSARREFLDVDRPVAAALDHTAERREHRKNRVPVPAATCRSSARVGIEQAMPFQARRQRRRAGASSRPDRHGSGTGWPAVRPCPYPTVPPIDRLRQQSNADGVVPVARCSPVPQAASRMSGDLPPHAAMLVAKASRL